MTHERMIQITSASTTTLKIACASATNCGRSQMMMAFSIAMYARSVAIAPRRIRTTSAERRKYWSILRRSIRSGRVSQRRSSRGSCAGEVKLSSSRGWRR